MNDQIAFKLRRRFAAMSTADLLQLHALLGHLQAGDRDRNAVRDAVKQELHDRAQTQADEFIMMVRKS